jgi:Domain of unknown function (DUF1905)
VSAFVTYGRGMVPVAARIGGTGWMTSLFSERGLVVISADPDGPPLGGLTWPGIWIVTGQQPLAGMRLRRWDNVVIEFEELRGGEGAGDREPRLGGRRRRGAGRQESASRNRTGRPFAAVPRVLGACRTAWPLTAAIRSATRANVKPALAFALSSSACLDRRCYGRQYRATQSSDRAGSADDSSVPPAADRTRGDGRSVSGGVGS